MAHAQEREESWETDEQDSNASESVKTAAEGQESGRRVDDFRPVVFLER